MPSLLTSFRSFEAVDDCELLPYEYAAAHQVSLPRRRSFKTSFAIAGAQTTPCHTGPCYRLFDEPRMARFVDLVDGLDRVR